MASVVSNEFKYQAILAYLASSDDIRAALVMSNCTTTQNDAIVTTSER